jgi:hypothetical protein
MSMYSRWLTALTGLVAALIGTGLAGTAPAQAAGAQAPGLARPATSSGLAIQAGFANAPGSLGLNQWVQLPAPTAFTTSGQPVWLNHLATGLYLVEFDGLGFPGSPAGETFGGVVQAHGWFTGGTCQPSGDPFSDGAGNLQVYVRCVNLLAKPDSRRFTVSYTRNGAEAGLLDTVHLSSTEAGKPVGTAVIHPAMQNSSLGGIISATHDATGRYTFTLPRLDVTRPHALEVSSTDPAKPAACGIVNATAIAGAERVSVACSAENLISAVDTPLSLSYAEEVNPLGLNNRVSHAYVTSPSFSTSGPSTIPVPATLTRNAIYGSNGPVTFARYGTGQYELQLQDQQIQIASATTSVTPAGFFGGRCAITDDFHQFGTAYQTVRFQCTDGFGNPKDTPFQFQYSAQQ